MNRTTAKDFKVFKSECNKWFKIFGLMGWHVRYTHSLEVKVSSKADCIYNVVSKSCELRLNRNYPHKVTGHSIKESAFHEVCEILLGDLVALAEYRYATSSEIEAETHTIIRTLEKVIWEKS